MKVWNMFLIATAIMGLSACGGNSEKSSTPGSTTTIAPTAQDWSVVKKQSDDGKVVLTKSVISDAKLQQARNEYRRANLIQLPVDAKYNATVLRITDGTIPEYADAAFIAPKLFSYGSQDGGRLVPIKHDDGTVTLAFNIAFLGGNVEKISKPNEDGTGVEVPSIFKIQSPEELKQVLASKYHSDNGLAPLPGCPKSMTLSAAGIDYDVTPNDFKTGDFCELNKPITVTLNVSELVARSIMEEALEANAVQLIGTFETKVSYPTSKINIKFNRSKILSDLSAELGVKVGWVDADVQVAIKKVMTNQLMTVSVQGEVTDSKLSEIMTKVSNEFFEPWTPTPQITQAPCAPSAPVCLRFKLTQTDESSTMDFQWANESNLLSGQNFVTTTKLKATPKQVVIGSRDTACTAESKPTCGKGLSNDAEAIETGLTVADGNSLIIEPGFMVIQQRDLGVVTPVHESHVVCTHSKQVCVRNDSDTCHGRGCLMISDYATIDSLLSAQSCSDVCDQTQDQFTDITNHYTRDLSPLMLDNPIGQVTKIYEGLQLEFHWKTAETGKDNILNCPLSSFEREGDGVKMKMRLINMPTCKPFTGIVGETPVLFIKNRISYTQKYKAGRNVTRWDGSNPERPTDAEFSPRVEFQGTISVAGYGFESATVRGEIKH